MQKEQTASDGQSFKMVAKTLFGLEDVLAQELTQLGAENIEIGRRMVSFEGDLELLYTANVQLRTALRVLKPILTFTAKTPDEVYDRMKRFEWSAVMTSATTFAIDTVVYSEHFSHSAFVGYRAKDAIVDYFKERENTRPSVRLHNPDLFINLHISHDVVTVSFDSSGESLHKRGYRVVQTPAPLNEVLAAGILLKAGWHGERDLLDPMCGSGTFLIEAALIATGTAPGIFRKHFAFERWRDFDADLFSQVYNDDSRERAFDHHIYGSDILHEAIRAAEANVRQAGMSRYISLSVTPMEEREPATEPMLLVMNPPYGERLKMNDAQDLYAMIGRKLKHNYPGCDAWIIAYKPEHFEAVGLKQQVREKMMNGALECELRAYELFAGSRKEYKTEGDPRGSSAPRSDDGERKSYDRNATDRRERRPYRPDDKPRRPYGDRKPYDHNERGDRNATDGADRNNSWPRDRFLRKFDDGDRAQGDRRGFGRLAGRRRFDDEERTPNKKESFDAKRYQVFRADDDHNNHE